MNTKYLLFAILTLMVGAMSVRAVDDYTYDGDSDVFGPANNWDSLDGSWDHKNGSDSWDGTGVHSGSPGGVMSLREGAVTFLRIQDTGDPGNHWVLKDPNSNSKINFGRQLTGATDSFMDEGVTLSFRIRLATTAPLDDQHPAAPGEGICPWPAKGLGYHIHNQGMGMVTLNQLANRLSLGFSLCHANEVKGISGFEGVNSDILLMNNLAGGQPSLEVDTADTHPSITARNYVPVADATAWNTFDVTIIKGGVGTHQVTISVNGKPAGTWDVTAGISVNRESNCIRIGLVDTYDMGAFDLDFIKVSTLSNH